MDVARGRITLDLVRSSLPAPGDGVMVFVCGTDGFVDALAGPIARVVDEATGKKKKVQGPIGGLLREAGFSEEEDSRRQLATTTDPTTSPPNSRAELPNLAGFAPRPRHPTPSIAKHA